MKDKNGVKVEIGDLMLEVRGSSSSNKKRYTSVSIYEIPSILDGRGTVYTVKGESTYYKWANPSDSYKLDLDKLPEGFLFAFKHGLHSLNIEDQYMELDIHEAISKTDWKKDALTPEIVDKLEIISKIEINSFRDIAEKWDELFSFGRVPANIVKKVLQLAGYRGSAPVNGEIGMACMQDHFAFLSVFEVLKKWKHKGILLEECIKADNEGKEAK